MNAMENKDFTVVDVRTRAELIGIPKIIIVSKKTLEQDCVEVRGRKSGEVKMMKISDL